MLESEREKSMAKKKIMIIDYGMGNVGSVAHALDHLGGNYFVSSNSDDLTKADAYILPGVGAFSAAMENLRKLNLTDELCRQVVDKKKAFFGICLGMQLLAKDSTEQGFAKGLGWINGHVLLMEPKGALCVPHVGWNNTRFKQDHRFFCRVDQGTHFYFDHSYHLQCDKDLVVATCQYGNEYVAAIHQDNIFATQFHPEKSQISGLKILRNYLNYFEGK